MNRYVAHLLLLSLLNGQVDTLWTKIFHYEDSDKTGGYFVNLTSDGGYIATGERLFFRWGYRELLNRRLVDIIQPDIAHTGGISEIRRIASMAEIEYIKFAPHNPNGPIATAASLHVCANVPNFLILETARDMPWHDKVQTNPLQIKNGYFELPNSPGLGTDLDENIIKERPFDVTQDRYVGSWNAEDNSPNDV